MKRNDPLVFEVCDTERAKVPLVRLRNEAMDQVAYIASRTNRSMCEVASEMILYASRHVEIREGKRYYAFYDGEA